MEKLVIEGGQRLRGRVRISGSKNASLPIMAATLLARGRCTLRNVPRLKDVETMKRLLEMLGARLWWEEGNSMVVDTSDAYECVAPYEIVKEMRASILVLGALVGRMRRAVVSYPGGCAIGERPIDLHLKGLEVLGCKIEVKGGYIDVRARRLKGARVAFEIPTVGGTENIMMAATQAEGETVIENAAREPEVVDLARMLKRMGAHIEGEGTEVISVKGGFELAPCVYEVIPDRIEAGTFLVASAITEGDVVLEGADASHMEVVIEKLREAGLEIWEDGGLRATMRGRPKGVDAKTAPYPGFPTDMQAQLMALMCIARGTSVITETVFENRLMHVGELRRMGADIKVVGRSAIVRGRRVLYGARVMATDLRASACLVLAGLCAEGITEVTKIHHIERGYEAMEVKLRGLGARIERVKDEDMEG